MNNVKIKHQSFFWIAIFSILVQVWGRNVATTGQITREEPNTCSSVSGFPKSCSEIQIGSNSSRLQSCVIYPDGPNGTALEVLCDLETEGGGWTIFQKRGDGEKYEFDRNWANYTAGFGSLDKNFWLGLDNIYTLTKNGDQELRVDLENWYGETAEAKYRNFSISDASDFYRLSCSGFIDSDTSAGNSMTGGSFYYVLDGMRFSTKDMDNDEYDGNCADALFAGGWWFNSCSRSWLNGLYRPDDESNGGITWDSWHIWQNLKKTEMKIRTKKSA